MRYKGLIQRVSEGWHQLRLLNVYRTAFFRFGLIFELGVGAYPPKETVQLIETRARGFFKLSEKPAAGNKAEFEVIR